MKKLLKNNLIYVDIILFVALFIIVSGIIGPFIIGTKLLYGFWFYIYGNLGKLVIFSFILFFLIVRDKVHTIKPKPLTKTNFFIIAGSLLLLPVFFWLARMLLSIPSPLTNLPLTLLTHFVLLLLCVLLLVGVFGYRFLYKFAHDFKNELLICLGLSLVLFVAIFQVWKLWPYLSTMVLYCEYFLYSHLYQNVYVLPPYGLFVNNFVVKIEEACSGLESIFLFTVLYLFIVVLDKAKLNLKRVIGFFPLLLLGLIVVNILRVFLLILVGVLISPQLMATLFHTYIGLILFVIYFLLFLRYVYRHLLK